MTQFSDGSVPRPAGVRAGVAELRAGVAEVRVGTAEVRAGTAELRAGVAELWAGVAEVGAGTAELMAGVAEVKAGTAELRAGVAEVRAGIIPRLTEIRVVSAVSASGRLALMSAVSHHDQHWSCPFSPQLQLCRTRTRAWTALEPVPSVAASFMSYVPVLGVSLRTSCQHRPVIASRDVPKLYSMCTVFDRVIGGGGGGG